MKQGSADSLQVLARCGLRPERRNQWETVLAEMPAPMPWVLQWVASAGFSCKARSITGTTCPSS